MTIARARPRTDVARAIAIVVDVVLIVVGTALSLLVFIVAFFFSGMEGVSSGGAAAVLLRLALGFAYDVLPVLVAAAALSAQVARSRSRWLWQIAALAGFVISYELWPFVAPYIRELARP